MVPEVKPVKTKPWWKSKTIWIGVLQTVGGLVALPVLGVPAGTAIAVKGVIDVLLRVVTRDGVRAGARRGDE
jgi:hypothetical protein